MPITQARVISLINSGLDYKQAFERLLDHIKTEYKAARSSGNWQGFADAISMLAQPALLIDEGNAKATLLIEQRHFSLNMKRNQREAQRAAKRRHPAAIATAPTAPLTLRNAALLAQPPAVPGLDLSTDSSDPESGFASGIALIDKEVEDLSICTECGGYGRYHEPDCSLAAQPQA